MSYGLALALHNAIYTQLRRFRPLRALVGSAIFDEAPSGTIPQTYVAFGPEVATDRSDNAVDAAEHRFVVSVVSQSPGFATAKGAAVAISDALHNESLTLRRGRSVFVRFERATATREDAASLRRIDLVFRARVEDPDSSDSS